MFSIEIYNLSKNYGKFQALKNIHLNVPKGTIFGLLGPNGAGKSTLIKSIAGAIKPTNGTIKVLGLDPLKQRWEIRKRIGYMPQSPSLYGDITALENISFFGKAQKVPNLHKEVADILKFTELESRANDKVRNFSGGMQKRVSLACALIHRPEILFLDEPTAAVDPHLKIRSWELFRELANKGVTIFVSTHLMDEAMKCDKLAILRSGELLVEDTPDMILAKGKTHISYIRNGENHHIDIESSSEVVLQELKKMGLSGEIHDLKIHVDDLESIVLNIASQNQ